LVPTASAYKDEQKLAMLQVNMALQLKQDNKGKDLTYYEYIQLLSHAASDYDNIEIKAKGKLQVNLHDINEDRYTEDTYDACDETPSEPFLTSIHLSKLYKHMHRTTTLNQIGAIITIEFEYPETDG
jgi:hypothetical protein